MGKWRQRSFQFNNFFFFYFCSCIVTITTSKFMKSPKNKTITLIQISLIKYLLLYWLIIEIVTMYAEPIFVMARRVHSCGIRFFFFLLSYWNISFFYRFWFSQKNREENYRIFLFLASFISIFGYRSFNVNSVNSITQPKWDLGKQFSKRIFKYFFKSRNIEIFS